MKTVVKNQILKILNSSSTPIRERARQLSAYGKTRRGKNRRIVFVIERLLWEYTLPIRPDEVPFRESWFTLDPLELDALSAIFLQSNEQYFAAVCGEFLWTKCHNKQYADIALSAYAAQCWQPAFDDDHLFTRAALGYCRIYAKYKPVTANFREQLDICAAYVSDHLCDNYCPLFILKGLASCNEEHDYIAVIMQQSIAALREFKEYEKARSYSEELIALYKKLKGHEQDISKLRWGIVSDYEAEANSYDWVCHENAFFIVHLIQKAMSELDIIGGNDAKEKRKQLAKRLDPVKARIPSLMKPITSGPIDISDTINELKHRVEEFSFEQILLDMANLLRLKSPMDTLKEIEKSGFLSSYFFPPSRIDEHGRKRYVLPSLAHASTEQKLLIATHRAARDYELYADIVIKTYILIAKEKFTFSQDTLRFLVEDNVWIPQDRQSTFLAGLVAGFELDLPVAMHLLMPQVENAIRNFAAECGAVVYKTYSDGTEEALSLESILNCPEIVDCLDETLLFNLRLFYTSNCGFGMRNIIAHGLDSDRSLQSSSSLAVWWFTFKLCCYCCPNLLRRVDAIASAANEGPTVEANGR